MNYAPHLYNWEVQWKYTFASLKFGLNIFVYLSISSSFSPILTRSLTHSFVRSSIHIYYVYLWSWLRLCVCLCVNPLRKQIKRSMVDWIERKQPVFLWICQRINDTPRMVVLCVCVYICVCEDVCWNNCAIPSNQSNKINLSFPPNNSHNQ